MTDVTEQLERLAALFDRSMNTREEFDDQKARLLAAARRDQSPTGPPAFPSALGAYKVFALIGEGGMGTLCRGRHMNDAIAERQGGDVAIKAMLPNLARDPQFQARFEREASVGLTLEHPGIVKVHDLITAQRVMGPAPPRVCDDIRRRG